VFLFDVNVLVYAYRDDAPDHARYLEFVEDVVNGDEPYGLSDLVFSGVIRVVTHPKVFAQPSPLTSVTAFIEELRGQSNAVVVERGPRHWQLFLDLCKRASAKGNHVPDAFLAALAIESGCEWVTTDAGFGRFPGLKWRRPFDD
jgi:toxin-antitoxin system PIN domain toxin